MKRFKFLLPAVLLLMFLLLAGCRHTEKSDNPLPFESAPETTSEAVSESPEVLWEQKARERLSQMTLEEKIDQLLLVRPEGLDPDAEMHVGGVVFFSKNIESPEQLKSAISALQAQAREAGAVPLFIAVDEEGGRVARIANHPAFDVPRYESMASIGASGDPSAAQDAARTIGSYLNALGFNLDFAPVADLNTNPDNPVIGDRSFGADPVLASEMVTAAVNGFHENGIMTCIKHFPGHGDTSGDTHDGYVSILKTWEELKTCELVPFLAALDTTDLVMTAHISTPNITDDGLPVSLSYEMITGRLRGELGYDGVVITDGLEMGAITEAFSSEEAAVAAILAGNDLILLPEDPLAARAGLMAAVSSGVLSEVRIDESVFRILRLKAKYGLF